MIGLLLAWRGGLPVWYWSNSRSDYDEPITFAPISSMAHQDHSQTVNGDSRATSEILVSTLYQQHPHSQDLKTKTTTSHRIAFIGSDRTFESLRWEVEVLLLTPENWSVICNYYSPELLLVESSFDTVGGHWDTIQSGDDGVYGQLIDLVKTCKSLGIPTVFWNTAGYEYKEYFLRVSASFDRCYYGDHRFIDESSEDRYLPVAFGPKRFNPLVTGQRNYDLLYDGLIDVVDDGQIIQGLLHHLDGYGLALIDSRNSMMREECEQVKKFGPLIVGSVHPQERVNFLRDSCCEIFISSVDTASQQQMVLEAIGCQALPLFVGQVNGVDVRKGLMVECLSTLDLASVHRELEDNPKYYHECVLGGWRKANAEHCMALRLQKIFCDLGIAFDWEEHPLVSVVSATNRMHQPGQIIDQFDCQLYPNKELLIMVSDNEGAPQDLVDRCAGREDVTVMAVPEENLTGAFLKAVSGEACGEYCVKLDDGDYYGEHYLSDMMLYQRITDASFFGQPPELVSCEGDPAIYEGAGNLQSNIVISSQKLNPELQRCWSARLSDRDVISSDSKVYAGEPVTYSLASIPERIFQLHRTLLSIINQANHIYVYLNNYEEIPSYLCHNKITVHTSQEHGDLAAAGKFFCVDSVTKGYFFTIDDDIIYPPDYTEKMVAALKKYNNQALMCVHSSIFGHPLEWYFERTVVFGLGYGMKEDRFVSLVGSGCLAFYRPALALKFRDFFPDVMCDLRISIMAREQGVLAISIARPGKWLTQQEKLSNNTYYDWMLKDDGNRTAVAKTVDWGYNSSSENVANWLSDLGISPLQAIKNYNLDKDFLHCMVKKGRIPKLWDVTKRKLYLRRKLQYLRAKKAKAEGKSVDNISELFPSVKVRQSALLQEIESLRRTME